MVMTRVVVVDDEVPIRENLRMFPWVQHHFELIGEARNGKDALALCKEKEPDIVITDIVMPVMDGLQLVQSLKEWRPRTQVILLSCHSDFQFARRALSLGANAYLLKGIYQENELLETLIQAKQKLNMEENMVDNRVRFEIRKAIRFIREHLNEQITLAVVADYVNLSPNYFGTLFHKETGEYFQAYVKNLRLKKSASLLQNSDLKVYEIAEEVGIPNYRYFTDIFYKHYGKTPKEFRKAK